MHTQATVFFISVERIQVLESSIRIENRHVSV